MNEAIRPMRQIVKQENKKIFNPSILKATAAINPSNIKITAPIFMEYDFEIMWANKSVPPVLALNRSMIPTPIPMNAPPKKILGKIESKNFVFKGSNQSIIIEAAASPKKLL